MAEHDERQRVGARRDAAAAIGDDLLFVERAGRGEFGAQRRCRQKGAVLRIDQRSRRHIDALRDAAGSAIGVAAAAGVLLTGERVDRADRAVADRSQHRFLADHQMPVLAHGEAGRRTRLPRTGFDGATLARPFLKPAVQHRGILETIVAQHPPDARRPLRRRRAVKDDAAPIADPEPAHRRGELLGVRHHKAELRVLRRKVGLEIDKLRAGDVAFLEILAP